MNDTLFHTQDDGKIKFPHVENLNVDGQRSTEERKDLILNLNFKFFREKTGTPEGEMTCFGRCFKRKTTTNQFFPILEYRPRRNQPRWRHTSFHQL